MGKRASFWLVSPRFEAPLRTFDFLCANQKLGAERTKRLPAPSPVLHRLRCCTVADTHCRPTIEPAPIAMTLPLRSTSACPLFNYELRISNYECSTHCFEYIRISSSLYLFFVIQALFPHFRTSIRTRPRPVRSIPIAFAAAKLRSITLSCFTGPRSLIRTSTWAFVVRFVTFTIVPNG